MNIAERFAREFELIPLVDYESGYRLREAEQLHAFRCRLAWKCVYDASLSPKDWDSEEGYVFSDGSALVVYNPTQAWGTAAWVELAPNGWRCGGRRIDPKVVAFGGEE